MAVVELRQLSTIISFQDYGYPDWYAPTTVVGDAATAWRDGSDASYAIARTPTDAQISGGDRQNSPSAAMELLDPAATDFTTITAHWRVSSESNYERRVAIEWGPYRPTVDPAYVSGDLIERGTQYGVPTTPITYSTELWPAPYAPWITDPEVIARKAQFLGWLKTGHQLNFWSVTGGSREPADYATTSKIYEAWVTVEYEAPVIAGRPDNVRRAFT